LSLTGRLSSVTVSLSTTGRFQVPLTASKYYPPSFFLRIRLLVGAAGLIKTLPLLITQASSLSRD